MDLKLDTKLFEKKIDPETGSILFYRENIKGIPDKVIDGDDCRVNLSEVLVYLIDIFNSEKVLENLLKNIELEHIA